MRIGILSIMCQDFSISLGPQKKSLLILFVYKLMIGSSKNNRENHPRNCFTTQEKETRVKFNTGLSANRPLNNWALYSRTEVESFGIFWKYVKLGIFANPAINSEGFDNKKAPNRRGVNNLKGIGWMTNFRNPWAGGRGSKYGSRLWYSMDVF